MLWGMKLSIDPRVPREYVCEADKALASELQTIFLLKAFTVYEEAELSALSSDTSPTANARVMIETVRHGLIGWRNLVGPDGTQVPYTKGDDGYASRQSIEMLPTRLLIELFQAIVKRESITVDEVGKS